MSVRGVEVDEIKESERARLSERQKDRNRSRQRHREGGRGGQTDRQTDSVPANAKLSHISTTKA